MDELLMLHCPECRDATLACSVEGPHGHLTVHLVAQSCPCDPFHAWEDVWEEAREIILESELGGLD